AEGRVVTAGDAPDVMDRYENDLLGDAPDKDPIGKATGRLVQPSKPPRKSTGLDIVSVHFEDADGEVTEVVQTGRPVTLCVRCVCHWPVGPAGLGVFLRQALGAGGFVLSLHNDTDRPPPAPPRPPRPFGAPPGPPLLADGGPGRPP